VLRQPRRIDPHLRLAGPPGLAELPQRHRGAIEVLDRAVDLALELGITGLLGELQRRLEIVGSRQEARPQLDLGPEAVGLAQDALRATGVVPEARLGSALVECGQAFLFAGKVKDAPRSIGSAPPGPGRVRRPPRS